MRKLYAGFVLLALSLSAVVGCSKGKGGPPEAPPTAPEPPKPAPKSEAQPEPEPEAEPVPGEPIRLVLPKDNGVWPWVVGKASEPPATQPVTFKGIGPYTITGIAVRPELNRAVVSIRIDPTKHEPSKKGGPAPKGPTAVQTRVVLCDIAAGKTVPGEWLIPGHYAILDLGPDGKTFLATSARPGADRNVLRLWTVAPDGQLRPRKLTPHSDVRAGLRVDAASPPDAANSAEVRWAAFVGADRLVSASRGGQLRVFDVDGLKPLATIDASPGRPAASPDGTKVAFLVGSSVALLDTTTLKVIATRWVGLPPPHPVLAFSPDGSRLAVGGNGRAILLDLTTGHLQNVAMPKLDVNDNGIYDKPFGWAGNTHLLADNLLHDPQLAAPVWVYTSAEAVHFRGSGVWVAARLPGTTTVLLLSHNLPGSDRLTQLAAMKSRPGVFALQPGGGVRIDVSGIPEDRRSEVQGLLEKHVREIGFTPDPNAPVTLLASVDSPGTKPTVIYSGLGPYQYTKKPARLRVVMNDKELWSDAWAVEPPFSVQVPEKTPLAEYLAKINMGGPDYHAFGIAPIPTHLPGPNAPSGPIATTDLSAPGQ